MKNFTVLLFIWLIIYERQSGVIFATNAQQ